MFSGYVFWQFLKRYGARIGRGLLEQVLCLYYICHDPGAPTRAKAIALGALGYLVAPLDVIPDAIVGVGFTDDAVVAGALLVLEIHVTPEIRAKAAETVKQWFG